MRKSIVNVLCTLEFFIIITIIIINIFMVVIILFCGL